MDIRAEREWLRQNGIRARQEISVEERERYSAIVAAQIMDSAWFQQAETVMLYQAMGAEVSLDTMTGRRFVYPKCTPGGTLLALQPLDEDAWERGAFGIYEPVPARSESVSPENIDLVICPCTAFDSRCARLGMGGGYYDRFLPQCKNAHIAAAAFSVQQTEKIPAQPWDWFMDAVFTESRVWYRTMVKT
ncbi:MAG: 5-formyltetrahydrofolate cyclo-ligase [Oscillospiraceae bacterium]|nr:5-formyltetrahydrofolate cyclo-ligase [Oscillospiraceae bacterium]